MSLTMLAIGGLVIIAIAAVGPSAMRCLGEDDGSDLEIVRSGATALMADGEVGEEDTVPALQAGPTRRCCGCAARLLALPGLCADEAEETAGTSTTRPPAAAAQAAEADTRPSSSSHLDGGWPMALPGAPPNASMPLWMF
jgi:hypothetical protein